MTDDPTARVRAVCDHADAHPGLHYLNLLDEAYDAAPSVGSLHDRHMEQAFISDVAAALDAKDAEIARMRAENGALRRDVAALRPGFRGDLTPADIGMIPVSLHLNNAVPYLQDQAIPTDIEIYEGDGYRLWSGQLWRLP